MKAGLDFWKAGFLLAKSFKLIKFKWISTRMCTKARIKLGMANDCGFVEAGLKTVFPALHLFAVAC